MPDGAVFTRPARPRYYHSDQEINWATQRLGLDRPIEDIYKNFSLHHRRNIRKAEKLNLKAEIICTPCDIKVFSEQYLEMYTGRGLYLPPQTTIDAFRNLFDFFQQNGNGYFLAVRSQEGTILGGICICYQGDSAFYYKGYTHPAYRHLPVGHLAMYHAMIYAKEKGKRYFDLGGYGINITESDPVYSINKFKDGYRAEYVVYPRTMLISTVPMAGWLYSLRKKSLYRRN
jgi:lipid II:glycine glycyltransferase (peptidoglycan interpeptide bridge formation enzyme)